MQIVLEMRVTKSGVKELQMMDDEVDWREYNKGHSLDQAKEIPDMVEWFEKVMRGRLIESTVLTSRMNDKMWEDSYHFVHEIDGEIL